MAMAKIYQFPDLNVEGYPVFDEVNDYEEPYTEEYINLQYEIYAQEQQDEYLYNQLMKREQEQNAQRKRRTCVLDRFVSKIISIFH